MALQTWDIQIRLIHAGLVLGVGGCLISGYLNDDWIRWHQYSGISVLCLVLFRIYWGFVGSPRSRFKNFVPQIFHLNRYFVEQKPTAGHSPQAALSVMTMLSLLLLQTLTGLFGFEEDSEHYAPLAIFLSTENSLFITGVHLRIVNLLIVFVALHIAAVAFYEIFKKKRLIKQMFLNR